MIGRQEDPQVREFNNHGVKKPPKNAFPWLDKGTAVHSRRVVPPGRHPAVRDNFSRFKSVGVRGHPGCVVAKAPGHPPHLTIHLFNYLLVGAGNKKLII